LIDRPPFANVICIPLVLLSSFHCCACR